MNVDEVMEKFVAEEPSKILEAPQWFPADAEAEEGGRGGGGGRKRTRRDDASADGGSRGKRRRSGRAEEDAESGGGEAPAASSKSSGDAPAVEPEVGGEEDPGLEPCGLPLGLGGC